MLQSFKCPSCGAPLDYEGGPELTMRCPFCDNSVIVPQALRAEANQATASRQTIIDQIVQLARTNKIQAIKLYRETFKVGLKEAKDAVEAIAVSQGEPPANLFPPAAIDSAFADLAPLLNQATSLGEITRLLQNNRKIEAIKLYRQTFNVGLKEAKDAVEAIAAGKSVQVANMTLAAHQVDLNTTDFVAVTSAPAQPKSRAGGWIGFIILVSLLAILAVILFQLTF